MSDDHASPADREGPESPEDYEPPTVHRLGTVEEFTAGPAGVGGDLNGMTLSF